MRCENLRYVTFGKDIVYNVSKLFVDVVTDVVTEVANDEVADDDNVSKLRYIGYVAFCDTRVHDIDISNKLLLTIVLFNEFVYNIFHTHANVENLPFISHIKLEISSLSRAKLYCSTVWSTYLHM